MIETSLRRKLTLRRRVLTDNPAALYGFGAVSR